MAFSFGFTSAALLVGCFTSSDDGDSLQSVPLASTRLTGGYDLVDYLFESGGVRLDTSLLKVSGTLIIGPDSVYRESILVDGGPTKTSGRIAEIRTASGNKDNGEVFLTLDNADSSAAGKSTFSFRQDTLMLVTEVSKERDTAKKGFRETAYYLRRPLPD